MSAVQPLGECSAETCDNPAYKTIGTQPLCAAHVHALREQIKRDREERGAEPIDELEDDEPRNPFADRPNPFDDDQDHPPPWDDQEPTLAERIRAKLVTTEQLRALPPPEPLVHGWLNLDSLAMMYGPSGAGKSFVAMDVAHTVGAARRWWHGSAVTPGEVLYVVAEGTPGASLPRQRGRRTTTSLRLSGGIPARST